MADQKKNPDMEEEVDIITLEFDEGEEVECEIMGVFDFNGKEYIALIPDDGTDDVYIYGYKEVGEDEFEIVAIDFFPLVDNYCVKIVYMKSNGKTGSLAISDFEY